MFMSSLDYILYVVIIVHLIGLFYAIMSMAIALIEGINIVVFPTH